MSRAMLPIWLGLALFWACAPGAALAAEEAEVHHEIKVRLEPSTHAIEIDLTIRFPKGLEPLRKRSGAGRLAFRLNADLAVEEAPGSDFALDTPEQPAREAATGHGEEGKAHKLVTREHGLTLRPGAKQPKVHLKIRGTIHHPLKAESEEYARSFSRTPGTISSKGVFLGGASWWLPRFGSELMTYTLAVDLPALWDAVSQGERTTHAVQDDRRLTTWTCAHPMDEVYLIANRFSEFGRSAGGVMAQAFLRSPDETLANKYLEATAQYIEMYRKLIGPYPFKKFALIENFWETGYGMPSFTLLGPRVIRLPFILHSSYPHEILHNWWGNSVYVDWESGNWCEGLTAYMADHLVREGQGRGTAYRRVALEGYRNYVKEAKDFPLTAFRSRHSSATQAVGYGKCLMLFHMLRRRLGDAVFQRALQRFYRAQRWKRASFDDLRGAFSDTSQSDLTWFFEQWVERTGAPELSVNALAKDGDTWTLELQQDQAGEAYRMLVPVGMTVAGQPEAQLILLEMMEKKQAFPLRVTGDIVRIDVDPEFDLFRRLHRAEIPPALSQMFGAERVTLVLPPKDAPMAAQWRALAQAWASDKVEVKAADELEALPKDRAVWVLGSDNPWKKAMEPRLTTLVSGVGETEISFGRVRVPRENHSFVYVVRHPDDPELAIGWIGTDVAAAIPGLARKLPHYGKYSYLAFEGDAPDNVAKGSWETTGSPLTIVLGQDAPPMGALPGREPLARLAPVFSPDRLMEHVRWLADPAREGRGVGTSGLDQSAAYIAEAFDAAGLEPGGDAGAWFQTFSAKDGPGGGPAVLKNVVGILPGTNPALEGQSVVLGAHYDHLGRGWPNKEAQLRGEIYNGADDNASGVSVLLELAHLLGKQHKPARSIVFVAFSGEEWGLKGSAHYVKATKHHPARQVLAMVNMDTVGRLQQKKIQVLGSGTASEWRHIAMGVGFTTGVESECISEDPGGSDQMSFVRAGIPGVQIFSGAHADYHRPTDDVEKIDAAGLVKVATFVREAIVYLGERPGPLTSSLKSRTAAPRPIDAPRSARRVSLGTVPDFGYRGAGVKVASVIKGSAADVAGIRAGDILRAIDKDEITSLRGFSEILRAHAPGDVVKVRLNRQGDAITVEATLRAR